jgi:hypothetical protein
MPKMTPKRLPNELFILFDMLLLASFKDGKQSSTPYMTARLRG